MGLEATARPAATILLLRDGREGLEVFMVVRHHAIDFAAGALVFPGGRVEDTDNALAGQAEDCPNPAGLDRAALAFRIAAIRETFEECGVLLARARGTDRLIDAAALWRVEAQHRAALNAGAIGFDEVLASEDLLPATDLLVHFAHWITPANQPKRYDTQFFLAEAPAEHLAVHDGTEAVDSIWIAPDEALAGAETGRFKLVFATAKNLEKLARSRNVGAALDAAQTASVVTVQPRSTRLEGTRRLLRIPLEAGYGGSEFIVDMPSAS
jgi:8-oxo-dGTP pyrophosphatase MutT (NUDIX family)